MTPNRKTDYEIEFDDPDVWENDDFDPYADDFDEVEDEDEGDEWSLDDDLRSMRW